MPLVRVGSGILGLKMRDGFRAWFLGLAVVALCAGLSLAPQPAGAQSYTFNAIQVEGNQRVEAASIVAFAGIERGTAVSAAALNAAFQRVQGSGLSATVAFVPNGNTLVIRVAEFATINRISFEGNLRLKDDQLAEIIGSTSRRVYAPAQAEADAAAITEAYQAKGRIAASVTPRIINRDDNRVDLVFEIREGKVVEIERLSFVGNQAFSDRRLRQVLETKQAGFLRQIIQRDTFVPERLEFDKRALTDFYLSRGYVDFQVLSATSDVVRDRSGFFITFAVREGIPYRFGAITVASEVEGVDAAPYQAVVRLRPGVTYSPTLIDNTIQRLEALALQQGLNFVRIDPRVTRDDRNQTLAVSFVLVKGPRVFVERIDIEGNATTLDKVVRRQFRTVEGDPFNPREIRDSAERIRALGYFSDASVDTREGSASDQVIVDVNVTEQPTGSLSFGVSYGVTTGVGFGIGFSEQNFLGRGQTLSVDVDTASETASSAINFIEPAFLGRDLKFRFNAYYRQSNDSYALYDTQNIGISPSFEFPVSRNGRLELRYSAAEDTIKNVDQGTGGTTGSSSILKLEEGAVLTSAVGYSYSWDTRRGGLIPNGALVLRFGQDFAGVGGDTQSIATTALFLAETKVLSEEVTLRAIVEGGALTTFGGNSRSTDRFFLNGKIRGFEPNGIGPRDLAVDNTDALGGNLFAVARFEADFPLGLPEEYGITGGAFLDVGSVWSLDNANGGPTGATAVDDSLKLRSAIGVTVYWTTPIGPLRFNFSRALVKESYDREQTFDLTVSTKF